jgi:hypothetical protein
MIASIFALCAAFAAAQTTAPALTTQGGAAPTVSELADRVLSSTDEAVRARAVDEMSRTAPISAQDVAALYDIFSRFPNPSLRKSVMTSLALMPSDSPQLEPLFVMYLKQPEPSSQLFGINGAFRLRARQALPLIHKVAEQKLDANSTTSVMRDRLLWNAKYEALSALAQWEGQKALPLLRKQAARNPQLGYLLGLFFWRQTLPDLPKWMNSSDPAIQQEALEAASAKIEVEEARATREPMLKMMRDPELDTELRHRLALKVGLSSTDDEVDALIREHDAAPDDTSREVWAAAVFASRSQRAVPLLVKYAKNARKQTFRDGVRIELVDLVGEKKTAELLGEKTGEPPAVKP